MSESRRLSGFPILIATTALFANAPVLADDGIAAAGKAAIYVLTLPEADPVSESDVPLWRQYGELRIGQFELAVSGEDGHVVKRMIRNVECAGGWIELARVSGCRRARRQRR